MEMNMYEIMEEQVFAAPIPTKRSKKVERDPTLVENTLNITINDDKPKISMDNFERRHEVDI